MGRSKVTIPGAGESKSIGLTGKSIYIESVPSYPTPDDIPRLSFNDPGDQLPALIRSSFMYPPDGCFDNLIITGTAESAGDEIIIFSTNACLQDQINPNAQETSKAIAGNTFTKTMDGTVQQLTELELVNDNGDLPASVYLSAQGNNISYRWNDGNGSDPTEDSNSDHILYAGNDPIEILGINFILNIKFVGEVAGQTPTLVITPRYYG